MITTARYSEIGSIRKGKSDRLGASAMSRFYMLHKIKRRAEVPAYPSLPHSTCCHTFGATGVELFPNGGTLEPFQTITNPEVANCQAVRSHPRGTVVRRSRENQMLNDDTTSDLQSDCLQ